jgi:hypothetical protein
VHFVVDDVACGAEVDGIDDFVVAIVFVSIEVFGLAAVSCALSVTIETTFPTRHTRIVEEQRIVRACVLHQPVHSAQYIRFRRLAHWVLLVICQDHHVLSLVSKVAVQICRHVLHIVDASPQLSPLPKVVDTDEESLPPAVTRRVLERVTAWCSVSEGLGCCGGWGRCIVVAVCPLVAVDCGHHA